MGNKAFFAGGSINGALSDVVDVYDSNANTWSVNHLSQARNYLAATSAGTKAIFAGGYSASNVYSSVVDMYDNASGTWSAGTLSQARAYLTATAVGSKAIFAGGYTGTYSKAVDIFDSSTGIWSTTQLSQARENLSATTVGNKAIFGGGAYSGGYSNVVDIYDNTTGLWSTSTLSQGRYNLKATSVGNRAIFAGGYLGSNSNVADFYDLNNLSLSFGAGTGNVTAYALSGGSLSAAYINMLAGGSFTGTGGTITSTSFNQSGGTVSFSGASALNLGAGSIASYNLSGGTLVTPTINISTGGECHSLKPQPPIPQQVVHIGFLACSSDRKASCVA